MVYNDKQLSGIITSASTNAQLHRRLQPGVHCSPSGLTTAQCSLLPGCLEMQRPLHMAGELTLREHQEQSVTYSCNYF